MQVATPPTASEFQGGIIGVTLGPVSGAHLISPITALATWCELVVQLPLTLPFTFSRHMGAASRTSSAGDMANSIHAHGMDQGCWALDSPADDCASSAQPLGHPHQDRHPGNGINTTCIEPRDIMARRQDISARLDFIARRDFIYSVYSDRPEVAPTPAPDVRDHFERPLSFYDKNCSQSISPGSASPHSFFHDSLVSNNWRAFDDCMHDSSRSRPHTVHVTRVEQPGNALQESAAYTDPRQFLFKMRQCGETLEQYFRDQCDKTRRRRLQQERVDLDYPLITYWRQQTEDMQEETTRMRLEILRETHAEIEDMFFSLYAVG